jgi:hypothetical protein
MNTNQEIRLVTADDFRKALESRGHRGKLAALEQISTPFAQLLSEQIIECTYHWNTEVRVAAFAALIPIRGVVLNTVIRDGLSDSDKKVRNAAAELFHREPLAA